ncbi:MAG: chemotaxis response regulator protein-glutamate methylesterase [Micavibrio aeruginosavorus]|uniref:Protein-glutamate methylesterase/protein-glutamine glutaminase n=1 Tax=Micavibrio aeruginosavorus TaxID=349221 RepID=A0A2W5HHU0_9BACT|nr:MAG: chemotaxis response regulator protein-glutamate methylesterase [Micavibrio aeruginosavorus]
MIVDDSAVVRGFVTRILESDPAIKVIYSAQNGQMAVNALDNYNPAIILLDIEMPVMDGLTAIPQLLAKRPNVKIIMCSTLTTHNASVTLQAMELGAVDCIGKPSTSSEISGDSFRDVLLNKIRSIGEVSVQKSGKRFETTNETKPVTNIHPHLPKTVKLRGPHEGFGGKPQILAIGSSTGGPNALFKVITHLKNLDIPIVLTQHMPATFTRILAEHISKHTGVPAVEGENGMKLENGRVHVAPGGLHMVITPERTIRLDDGPMENFCKPAVDPMLRSLLPLFGDKILTVILTGMGQDGLRGSREVVERGGRIVAQDEATSVVWGMPGAVALAGLCSAVLPLDDVGPYVRKAVMR